MPKEKMVEVVEAQASKVEKECPKCHATKFQGPWFRGGIVDGKFIASEELYNCVGCHTVLAVREMADRVSMVAPL